MGQFVKRPMLEPSLLESICRTIGHTDDGLTGREIGKILADCNIQDTHPAMTKWERLYNTFVTWQNKHQCSNSILKFIQESLAPVRYIGKEDLFQYRRIEVNKRLSFIGHELTEAGKYRIVDKTNTISEAEQRASKFKYKLQARNSHVMIYKYCSAELLVENYFHAVFEATKSIADRIRDLTNLTNDGNQLIDLAFSTTNPRIKINEFKSDTDRSEHTGLSNLLKGILSLVRNPTAHEPKIKFKIEEEEALDIMSTISFAHKRLDKAIIIQTTHCPIF